MGGTVAFSHDSSPRRPTDPTIGACSVQVITTPGCHLCAEAVAVVERVAGQYGVPWQEVALERLPAGADKDRWSVEVPVLLIDGVQRDFWQIDPARLARLLRERG